MTKTQEGAATLVMTLILLMIAGLLAIFSGNISRLQNASVSNINRSAQAFEAAVAGQEFGIVYLAANTATILANPVSGHINAYTSANTTNVSLPNNASFSITYSNPIANNYNLINISTTGASNDGTSTHTISQQVSISSVLVNVPTNSVTSQKGVNLNDNGTVKNLTSSITIRTGGATVLSNNAQTYLSSGINSSAGNIKSDIQQNQSSLSGMTANDFFISYFGAGINTIKSAATYYYSSSSNHDYSAQVNNLNNALIWIDQAPGTTATIQSNRTIGTPTNPVVLIVNGGLTIQDNVTIYGFVFVNGATSTSQDNVTIHGALASTDNLTLQNNFLMDYSASVLNNLKSQTNTMIIAKIPGSWKDF